MALLLHANRQHHAGIQLREMIAEMIPQAQIQTAETCDRLVYRLPQPGNDVNVAVLLAATREELGELLSLRDWIFSFQIILIVPDSAPETIAMGHRLRPRFMAQIDDGLGDVEAVLRRMVANSGRSSADPEREAAILFTSGSKPPSS